MGEKIGLVLAGGASKGSWQAGALMALIETYEAFPWDFIVGTSVGALNGAMIAVGGDPTEIWRTLETDKVYKKYNKLKIGWRLITGEDSAYSTDPLLELLFDHLLYKEVQTPLTFVATDAITGDLVVTVMGEGYIFTELDLDLLRASASMPILFDPVLLRNQKLVDGGVRQNNPLGTALQYDPDKLVVILCGPLGMETKQVSGMVGMATRTIDIFMNEIFNDDLNQFLAINDLVKQANEHGVSLYNADRTKEYKYFDNLIIAPSYHLGDGMDFSSGLMQQRLENGYFETMDQLRERALDL